MVDDVSRIKYSCSQVADTVSDETKQLDFYFLYKIDAEVDSKVELNRLQVAYVYSLASTLLPCAGDEDSNKGSKSNDHLFTVVAIDSAKQDEVLEIGEKYIDTSYVVQTVPANDIQYKSISYGSQFICFPSHPLRNLFFFVAL